MTDAEPGVYRCGECNGVGHTTSTHPWPVAAPIPDAAPNEYTPSDQDLLDAYLRKHRANTSWRSFYEAEFDRWLAAHDRAVRDAALTEAAGRKPVIEYGATTSTSPEPMVLPKWCVDGLRGQSGYGTFSRVVYERTEGEWEADND